MVDADDIIGIVIGLIIIVSVGIAFTSQQVTTLTSLTSVTNETFNSSTQNADVILDNSDIRGTPTVLGATNGTGLFDGGSEMGIILQSGNYTIDNPGGSVNFSNSGFALGLYNITYDFAAGTFVEDASTITIMNLFILFLAIGGLLLLGKGINLF